MAPQASGSYHLSDVRCLLSVFSSTKTAVSHLIFVAIAFQEDSNTAEDTINVAVEASS